MTAWIRRSKFGLGLVAIRDDEDKAAGIGVVTPAYKALAFMASAVWVGMAGAVYGYYVSFLTVGTMFDIVLSMQVVLVVLLGGRGTVWGPVLGAFIVVPLAELTNTSIGGMDAGAIRLVMFGGLLLLVTMALPKGNHPHRSPASSSDVGSSAPRAPPARGSPTLRCPQRPGANGPPPTRGSELLRVDGVTVQFGGVRALDDASLQVPSGSITALIGPNGSGKTTLFNVIDGTYTPASGDVVLAGSSLTGLDRTRRAFAGIGRTYQLPRLFDSLTVLENVAAVSSDFRLRRLAHSAVSGAEAARATELLEFVGLGDYVGARATDLSYGQRKLVELAQMLMLDPAVILLDEPAAGINPTLLQRLSELIRSLNAAGRTFVIVEHDMHFVLSLADRATVLARGRVIATGDPARSAATPRCWRPTSATTSSSRRRRTDHDHDRAHRRPGRLRRGRRPARRRSPDRAPLDHLHRRPQRRREVDRAARPERSAQAARGRHHPRRPAHPRPHTRSGPRRRCRPGAAAGRALRQPDRPRQHAGRRLPDASRQARPSAAARRAGRGLPGHCGPGRRQGVRPVRRAAADRGVRAGAGDQPLGRTPRRADARPGPQDLSGGLRQHHPR